MDEGRAKVSFRAGLAPNQSIKVGPIAIDVDGGELRFAGQAEGTLRAGNLALHDGSGQASLDGRDLAIAYGTVRSRFDGTARVDLDVANVAVDTKARRGSARGTLAIAIEPEAPPPTPGPDGSPEERVVAWPPLLHVTSFDLTPDGKLALLPGEHGLAELISPFFDVAKNADRIVDPLSPRAGAIDSDALRKRLEQVSDALLVSGSHVKLLVDGIQSFPVRMDLIGNARESIFLQTLIFKDDETGTATAEALVAAHKRGVDVRVIVDAVGNIEESLRDLT